MVTMQYDLEHSKPSAPTQDPNSSEHVFLAPSKDYSQAVERQLRPSSTVWRLVLMMGDGMLLVALLTLALMLASNFDVKLRAFAYVLETWNLKLTWIFPVLLLWSIAVNMTKSQELANATSRLKSPLYALFTLLLMSIFWMMFTFPLADEVISSTKILLFFLVMAVPVFSIWRVVLAGIMSLPRFRPLAVIVGVNAAGGAIAKDLRNVKHPIANVLGYIGENNLGGLKTDGLPILGDQSMLRYLVHHCMIDMIIVALDYKDKPELFKEVTEAGEFGISILPMVVAYESNSGKIPIEHVGDQRYVALPLTERPLSPFYLCWRKVMDFVCGFCGILILGLMLPVLAALICIDSPGSIFYSQERLGKQGKPFRIYKLRSMCIDAENKGHAVWATKYDPRITKIGRFLRATHLDELPQLLNILKGDMSLIGPRPERAEFANELEKTVPFYRFRLAVKPGLTGWAQVKYRYCSTDIDALIKLQYDLYYIKHQSFILDIFIILKTVVEVLFARGV
jgi:exopolysaccharide biosynthesis polyprenyl glycosylphosphotransferase